MLPQSAPAALAVRGQGLRSRRHRRSHASPRAQVSHELRVLGRLSKAVRSCPASVLRARARRC